MNKKLTIFLLLIAFVFGYTVYESMKLESKLTVTGVTETGTIIQKLPEDILFHSMEDNKKYDLNTLLKNGNFVVIHFWGTYCGPCKVEFPELAELTQLVSTNKKIKFIFVAIDDDLKAAKKFIDQHNFAKENTVYLYDNNKEYRRLGTYKLPETFLFGAENKVIRKFTGGQPWTQKHLVDYFKYL